MKESINADRLPLWACCDCNLSGASGNQLGRLVLRPHFSANTPIIQQIREFFRLEQTPERRLQNLQA
ncbi:hypothetical protein [Novosphingobium cyanobacteriorum]|uniref:Uncharacterized protein n=1 Tax=Novosphingobium cyanobacteriorum TaxID=3024215 RepID=A0ABT6CIW4_9SPHN|nr:hypothetical protein [Novosphingobium cyanobacteriorum]MDF8333861.1 hypothetical protein [Novosphingobium cyanobacteriorum]